MERIGTLTEKVRVWVWRKSGKREVDDLSGLICGGLRDRERDFGRRREEATIGGGGFGEPALPIWFRPKLEKVRVWVWRKSGKREVDAQSPWLLLAVTVFRSTNSGRGSGKVPLSLSLIFPSFNFLKKKKKIF